jgi:cobyric acid synthase
MKIRVKGLFINNFDSTGYPISELKRDLSALTNLPVLCSLPHLTKFNLAEFSEMITNQVNISTLIN